MTGVVSTLKNNKRGVQWLDDITLKDAQNIDTYIKLKYSPRIVNNLGLYLNSDIGTLSDMIYTLNGTAWDRLYTSYTADYNPIWNVDGTETITEERDLQATDSGKSTNNRTGTDSVRHTGTDTMADSGSDSLSRGGTYTTTDSGSDVLSSDRTVTETTRGNSEVGYNGSETIGHTGTDSLKHTGNNTTTESGSDKTTTDIRTDNTQTTHNTWGYGTTTPQPTSSDNTNHTGDQTVTVDYGHKSTNTFDESNSTTYGQTETKSFNKRVDNTVTNSTASTKNSGGDTTQYGKVETVNDERSETTNYGKKSTNTKDLSDSTTYGSGEYGSTEGSHTDKGTITTTHKRGGNIGVTMTQQMLQADLDYWKQLEAKFFERVCKDIVDMITYKIYTVSDESSEDVGGVSIGDYVKDIVPTLHEGVKIADVHIVQAERED